MKAVARAHPMEALVKYHGLKNWRLRIPYHDSISVNIDSLWVETEVEFGDFQRDKVLIAGRPIGGRALTRTLEVINVIRRMADIQSAVTVKSINSLGTERAKGLGFSAAAGAAVAAAAFKAAELDKKFGWDFKLISRIARRLAGSAARSVVGEYARWYAGKDDATSYAEKIATRSDLDMAMLAIPFDSHLSTEMAHEDAVRSPFFYTRIKTASKRVVVMQKAIKDGDLKKVGELSEQDSLELHALTMTGPRGLIFYRPESIMIMNEIRRMREEGLKAYFSLQTGPSVFVNTYPESLHQVRARIERMGFKVITASVGGEVKIVTD